MDEAKQVFSQESEELLEEMEAALLELEQAPDDAELINALFRAMHTIKGAAGVFGFDVVVDFTHPVETEVDKFRSGERAISADDVAGLLDFKDHTASFVTFVVESDGDSLPAELQQVGQQILARLIRKAGEVKVLEEDDACIEGDSEQIEKQQPQDNWLISLQFKSCTFVDGFDPLSFIRYLRKLGDIVDIITVAPDMPEFEQVNFEDCFLGFYISFHSNCGKQEIEDAFSLIEEDCELKILPSASKMENFQQMLEQMPDDDVQRLGDMLLDIGAITERELEKTLSLQINHGTSVDAVPDNSPRKMLGELLVEEKAVEPPLVEQALKRQQAAQQQSKLIRVDADKLGRLINLVGELVISSAAMTNQVEKYQLTEVEEVVAGVEHLAEEIRDHALQLRMVQIGDTFTRFRRVVRDVSRDLCKKIDLKISGGESELDKTVVEKINDPLTHLVRNCLDHGIESPEQRLAAGKPEQGQVILNAFHDSGHIVIEVEDDGAGLDPQKIRAKAESIGLISAEQVLAEQEIFQLIFEPGLSTKQTADNLSGRGVGMDVVRRNIEALRGNIEIDSELGVGTKISIQLPLTLAIIDGFMVGTGNESYVIPLSMIEECVEMNNGDWEVDRRRQYVNLRGEVMPYIHLGDFFDVPDYEKSEQRESLVVVRIGRSKAGFVVDRLYGEQQTVIKPIGKVFQQLKGISGATVLGSGEIALIIDVQGMIGLAHSQQRVA
jgi:two-component system chemotaxis sensor kinase CheA